VRSLLLILVLCAACSLGCSGSGDPARTIEAQVWSPYCPGRLLVDCSTQQARELRGDIADRIDRGESEREVLAWVRTEFGDGAIARPEASGVGLVIWLVPALLFAAGAVIVWRFVSRNVVPSTEPGDDKEITHADP
jgi:cytochrome c-type biogenesis protein CcmH